MGLFEGYLFTGLTAEQLGKVAAVSSEIPMEAEQRLFTEDQDASNLYILKSGAVELMSKVYEDFHLPAYMLREPGSLFGASSLIPPYRYTLTARCSAAGNLLRMDRAALQGLMAEDLVLASTCMTNLAAYFLDRLKETRHQVKIHFKILLSSTRS